MRVLWTIVGIIILTTSTYAHMESLSIEEMINSVMTDQNASSVSELDCSKIPDSEFEELGDATMERMVGDSKLHEQMDTMMGGEGSASLTQMHIIMGKNWLGCDGGFQGMMGTNMMPMMMRMMGNYYPAYYSGYNVFLTVSIIGWILATILFVILILVFTGKITVKGRK